MGGYDLIWDGGPVATAGDPELASRLGTRNTRADHRARMERQVGAMRGAGSARMALHSLSVCLFSFFFFLSPLTVVDCSPFSPSLPFSRSFLQDSDGESTGSGDGGGSPPGSRAEAVADQAYGFRRRRRLKAGPRW